MALWNMTGQGIRGNIVSFLLSLRSLPNTACSLRLQWRSVLEVGLVDPQASTRGGGAKDCSVAERRRGMHDPNQDCDGRSAGAWRQAQR